MTYEEFQENYPVLGRSITRSEFVKVMSGDFEEFKVVISRMSDFVVLEAENLWAESVENCRATTAAGEKHRSAQGPNRPQ